MRAALILCVVASPAMADLNFCNETSERASVAIGYNDGGVWTSEGWWRVEPGQCRAVVKGDLSKRFYYWRATSSSGAVAEGEYSFCTEANAFTIAGDEDCEARGYRREKFHEAEIGEATDYSVYVTAGVDDGPPQEDQGPGTFGEPITIVAEFRGCWAVSEDIECEFAADGWLYVASEAGPTDPAIMSALNVFSEGMRLQVSGDLISYAGDRADIMIREIDIAPPADPEPDPAPSVSMDGLMDHMQGFWDSDAGDGYAWIVEGNFLREIYDGNIMRESYFEIAPECAASDGQGPVVIAWPEPDEGDGPSCYVVTETGPRHMAVYDVLEGNYFSFSYSN